MAPPTDEEILRRVPLCPQCGRRGGELKLHRNLDATVGRYWVTVSCSRCGRELHRESHALSDPPA